MIELRKPLRAKPTAAFSWAKSYTHAMAAGHWG
jgi:hypothetical protein